MSEVCGEPHPTIPDVSCEKPRPCYIIHFNQSIFPPDWDGNPPPTGERRRKKVDEIAGNTPMEDTTGPPDPTGPFVRKDDPPNAHEAIRRYEPKRETCKGRVLAYLRARPNQWVDAPVLTVADVGGFQGTRRLRELRDDGWPIETRPKPGTTNTWQHRLVEDEPAPAPPSAPVMRDWD